MIGTICWMITIMYNIAATLLWRRTFNDFRERLTELQADVTQLKLDEHKAINDSADNRINLLAAEATCRMNSKRVDEFEERTKQMVPDMISASIGSQTEVHKKAIQTLRTEIYDVRDRSDTTFRLNQQLVQGAVESLERQYKDLEKRFYRPMKRAPNKKKEE